MGQEKTEKKEIVEKKEIAEMNDSRVEARQDEEKILKLSKTYEFEGEKISSLDFSGLENLTANNMIKANNIMDSNGIIANLPENTMYYALIIASDATGMPMEFLEKLNLRDAYRTRRKITHCFFGEG